MNDPNIVHEYDGIQEADNILPRWWLYTLYGAIIFAVGYWLYYHSFGTGASPRQAFDVDKAERARIEIERINAAGPLTPERLMEMATNVTVVSAGKDVFVSTCASCHEVNAGGKVGPNLTDDYWIHGGAPDKIVETVRNGFVEKGMPAWGPQLGENNVRQVTAYVLSLRGTNVPGGKAPQGNKE